MDPHPSVEARKIPPRSGGVIARSLACLAKYRAENQQSDKTPLYEVKPPPMDEASDVSTRKEVKAETVELPTEDMPTIDEKVRICLLYEFRLGSLAEVASYNLNKVFGVGAISLFSVTHYYGKFRRGDTNLETKQKGKYSIVDPDIVFCVNGTTISRLLKKMKKGAVLPKFKYKAISAEKLLGVSNPTHEEKPHGLPMPVSAEKLLLIPTSNEQKEPPRVSRIEPSGFGKDTVQAPAMECAYQYLPHETLLAS
ncbi:hypothetical protein GCK32_014296 [Trichostrongylus colubriformis]|uniref:Mos1 transposase HTH domain-containing protein n=1 Tax=Trichostrongylus colubriformis TaxID=6319 RepID=A0AAN8IEJ4_TRICO